MIVGPSRQLSASCLRPSTLARCSAPRRTLFSLPDLVGNLTGSGKSRSSIVASAGEGEEGKGKGKYTKDGDVLAYHERKVLPYSPRELYSVIADIEAYSSFVPYCTRSTVLSCSPSSHADQSRRRPWLDEQGKRGEEYELKAELRVGFKGFEEGYVSRVQCRKWESVKASASDSALFKELSTLWRLSSPSSSPLSHSHSPPDLPSTAIDPSASSTLVSLDLAFAFRNPLHAVVGETVFRKMAERMVDAFERRMAQVHSR